MEKYGTNWERDDIIAGLWIVGDWRGKGELLLPIGKCQNPERVQPKIQALATGKAGGVYLSLTRDIPAGLPASQFATRALSAWQEELSTHSEGGKQSISGKFFELLIADVLAQYGVLPFYWQAEFALVPNAKFDFICYRPAAPVVLAAKTSLRERYKQADLEGMALKQVYRRAACHLITANAEEAERLKKKIVDGEVVGIDRCVLANTAEFDALIAEMGKMTFSEAKPIKPIGGTGQLIR